MRSPLAEPAYRAFVERAIELRHERGLTVRQVAERLGRPHSFVVKSECFERRLDPAEFRALILALDGDPAEEFARVSQALAAAAD